MRLLPNRQTLPWWLLIISIAFNLGFGATYGAKTYAPAGAGPGRAGLGGGTMALTRLHENLNLTPQQRVELQRINEALLREINVIRDELGDARIALSQLLGEPELDREAVKVQLDAISATQRNAQRLVVDHLLQEKQVLDAEQLEAFNEVIRTRVCPGYGRGGGGGGRGMGRGQGMGRGRGRRGGG
jgi:Spy/CpxP family protein refolding chaperone